MCNIIWSKFIANIMFLLRHYAEDGTTCDEHAGPCLLKRIGGTYAPIVNILVIYDIKFNIWTHYVGTELK